eukprot:gb/GECH01008435.1/.p1 GENE.gb/GECH01008435.1/~~gb/GECH01008435.1/.p1  ORF type:complete len:810 (+),score=186.21 gb/GECH01008435.1/:1-2430(+)
MPFGFFKKKNNNQNNTTNDKTLNTPEKNHDTTGQSKSIQGQRPHALNTSTVSSSLASSTSSSLSMAHYHHYYHPEMAQESSPPGVHAFSSSSFSKNSKSSHLPFNQRHPSVWNGNEVCLWLKSIGLSRYEDIFANNDITGEELCELQISDLDQIGVNKIGHQKKIMKRLEKALNPSLASKNLNSTGTCSDTSSCSDTHPMSINVHSAPQMADSPHTFAFTDDDNPSDTSTNTTTTTTTNTNSWRRGENTLVVKCVLKDRKDEDNIRMLIFSLDEPFENIMRQICSECGTSPHNDSCDDLSLASDSDHVPDYDLNIKFKDLEGDLITLRNESDFRAALECSSKESYVKLWVTCSNNGSQGSSGSPQPTVKKPSWIKSDPRLNSTSTSTSTSKAFTSTSTSTSSSLTTSVLDKLADAAILIDTQGIIRYANQSTEKVFGYESVEMIGRNISMLMPDSVAREHNFYLERYQRTAEKKIIGKSRKVNGLHRDGSLIKIWITISEHHQGLEHGFKGTIHLDQETEASSDSSNSTSSSLRNGNANSSSSSSNKKMSQSILGLHNIIKGLNEASIITNKKGKIMFINTAAETLLEWNATDIERRNVSHIVPPAYIDRSDRMQEYIKTGGIQSLGQAWDTMIQTRSGSILPVTMTLSKYQEEDRHELYYVNIIRERNDDQEKQRSKSMLEQEREVIGNLALPGVIIDAKGLVQGFNGAAGQLLGYSAIEVLGRNVKMILPPGEHQDRHDEYIQRYLNTGNGGVIGKTARELYAWHKEQRPVPIWLSVTERKDMKNGDGARIFTGILHPRDVSSKSSK